MYGHYTTLLNGYHGEIYAYQTDKYVILYGRIYGDNIDNIVLNNLPKPVNQTPSGGGSIANTQGYLEMLTNGNLWAAVRNSAADKQLRFELIYIKA